MTLHPETERERIIARVMLSEVIRKLEEALRLQKHRACTRAGDLSNDSPPKEFHE